MNKIARFLTGAGIAAALSSPACAGSEILPGISTGIALGAPLPEGIYSITIPTYGERNSTPQQDVFGLDTAWLIWSTPYTFFGGRIMLDTVTPYVNVNLKNGPSFSGAGNTIIDMQIKWDLGGGFFGGIQGGVYLPVSSEVGRNGTSFQGVVAFSYLKDGWNLSSTFISGTGVEGMDGGPAWFNVDLTATKTFGKFEIGAIAFGSTDLSSPFPGYARQSQFAVGGLVGYDFGPMKIQLKLSRDVYEDNYGGYDTRGWANIIVPLWMPAPPTARAAQ